MPDDALFDFVANADPFADLVPKEPSIAVGQQGQPLEFGGGGRAGVTPFDIIGGETTEAPALQVDQSATGDFAGRWMPVPKAVRPLDTDIAAPAPAAPINTPTALDVSGGGRLGPSNDFGQFYDLIPPSTAPAASEVAAAPEEIRAAPGFWHGLLRALGDPNDPRAAAGRAELIDALKFHLTQQPDAYEESVQKGIAERGGGFPVWHPEITPEELDPRSPAALLQRFAKRGIGAGSDVLAGLATPENAAIAIATEGAGLARGAGSVLARRMLAGAFAGQGGKAALEQVARAQTLPAGSQEREQAYFNAVANGLMGTLAGYGAVHGGGPTTYEAVFDRLWGKDRPYTPPGGGGGGAAAPPAPPAPPAAGGFVAPETATPVAPEAAAPETAAPAPEAAAPPAAPAAEPTHVVGPALVDTDGKTILAKGEFGTTEHTHKMAFEAAIADPDISDEALDKLFAAQGNDAQHVFLTDAVDAEGNPITIDRKQAEKLGLKTGQLPEGADAQSENFTPYRPPAPVPPAPEAAAAPEPAAPAAAPEEAAPAPAPAEEPPQLGKPSEKAQVALRPLTPATFNNFVYPWLKKTLTPSELNKVRSIARYERANPNVTHIATFREPGGGWQLGQVDNLSNLREAFPSAELRRKRTFSMPYAPMGARDIIDAIHEQGGIRSREQHLKMKKPDGGEWDSQPELRGVYRRLIRHQGGLAPDEMAQALADEGFAVNKSGEPDVEEMWRQLDSAVKTRQSLKRSQLAEAATMKAEKAKAKAAEAAKPPEQKAFEKETKKGVAGKELVHPSQLNVGDQVTIGGEKFDITHVDPDTLDVTLSDGDKYGVQHIEGDQLIYVDSSNLKGEPEFLPPEEQTKGGETSAKGLRQDEEQIPPAGAQPPSGAEEGRTDLEQAPQGPTDRGAGAPVEAPTIPVEPKDLADEFQQHEAPGTGLTAPGKPVIPKEGTGEAFGDQTPFNLGGEETIDAEKAQREADALKEAQAKQEQAQGKLLPEDIGKETPEQMRLRLKKKRDQGGFTLNPAQAMKELFDEAQRRRRQLLAEVGGDIRGKASPLNTATTISQEMRQMSTVDQEEISRAVHAVAPRERTKRAMSAYLEAGGDLTTLQDWAAKAKSKWLRLMADDAQHLTPEQQKMADAIGDAYKREAARGFRYGVLDKVKQNYIPHFVDVGKTARRAGVSQGQLLNRFRHNIASTFRTFYDMDQAGAKPRRGSTEIDRAFNAYKSEMDKVISHREFAKQMFSATRDNGMPHIIPETPKPKIVDATDFKVEGLPKNAQSVFDTRAEAEQAAQDYQNARAQKLGPKLPGMPEEAPPTVRARPKNDVMINPRVLQQLVDEHGNPIDTSEYVKRDEPALADWRFATKDPITGGTTYYKSGFKVSPELNKRLNAMTGQSWLRKAYQSGDKGLIRVPKAIARGLDKSQAAMKREMFGMIAPFHQVQEAWHAVGHRVNPLGKVMGITMGHLDDMSKLTPEHRMAMRNGLILKRLDTRAQMMEGLGARNALISHIARNYGGTAGRIAADLMDGYQNYLFDQYIPALKFKTYKHMLDRNMKLYKNELASGEVTARDVGFLSAEQANSAFGHLNLELLDRNPTFQHALQLVFLAPDFLEGRARFLGQALKPGKAGVEQLKAIGWLMMAQMGSAWVTSNVFGDGWDPQHPFEARIGNRSYTLRSVPEDAWRLFFGGFGSATEFASARVNPLLAKMFQLGTGRNYRGERTDWTDTLKETAANYIPIVARTLPGIRNLTESTRNDPVTPFERFLGSVGLRVSRYSPITKTYQNAFQYNQAQGVPKDRGVYPVSKYQRLRYALEDNDLIRARKEYDALKASGMQHDKISKGFTESINHPFTGNQQRDAQFYKSLGTGDRALYEQAKRTRAHILSRFGQMINYASTPQGR